MRRRFEPGPPEPVDERVRRVQRLGAKWLQQRALEEGFAVVAPFGADIADVFDERDEAVKRMLAMTITACRKRGKYVGICGQGPSDHADLAMWLLDQGIESMSLNPDTVIETWMFLAGESV